MAQNAQKASEIRSNSTKFSWGTCPQTLLAWHRPLGALSFVSPSKKKILGAPKDDFGGGRIA